MANVEIKVPTVGESINEATIARWNFKNGDYVQKDAVVFEIETEKATMEVTAPASGRLSVQAEQGQTVAIGAVVGSIDTSAEKSATGSAKTAAPPPPPPRSEPAYAATSSTQTMPPPPPRSTTASASTAATAPPVSRPASVSAAGGVEMTQPGMGPALRKAIREGKAPAPTTGPSSPMFDFPSGEQERKPMTTIRKKIAERLLHSQHSTATLTTFNEVDMTNILEIRKELQEKFTAKNGVKLGFMSFFTKAVVSAAREVPVVNAFIDGNDIVYNKHVHAGIAVSTDRGLVVPVLRYADRLSYGEIEKGILNLAEKARTGKLGIEEMMGGTFTITNGGVFGSLLSTPILNPPQSGILGMHKTENRVMALDDGTGHLSIQIRPMMYVALSYDHRIIDGRDSVTFLVKVKEYLETVKKEEIL